MTWVVTVNTVYSIVANIIVVKPFRMAGSSLPNKPIIVNLSILLYYLTRRVLHMYVIPSIMGILVLVPHQTRTQSY